MIVRLLTHLFLPQIHKTLQKLNKSTSKATAALAEDQENYNKRELLRQNGTRCCRKHKRAWRERQSSVCVASFFFPRESSAWPVFPRRPAEYMVDNVRFTR